LILSSRSTSEELDPAEWDVEGLPAEGGYWWAGGEGEEYEDEDEDESSEEEETFPLDGVALEGRTAERRRSGFDGIESP
jgi:hypothetical protein